MSADDGQPGPDRTPAGGAARFIPDAYSDLFLRFFGWWCREKMLAKRFYAVRAATESLRALRSLSDHDGPVLVLTNHTSWWDPLLMLMLHRTELCREGAWRSLRAPMDADQLERFRFFRKLGAFGIDPDDPASLELMARHVGRYFREDRAPTLWINPQGRFADVREPVEIRPGAAKLAAEHRGAAVALAQFEYVFWLDAKPEILLRFDRVEPGRPTTTGWLRAMRRGMNNNAARLAELAIARDPGPFTNLLGGEGANVHPVYGLWLRLRGRAGSIDDRRDRRDRWDRRRSTRESGASVGGGGEPAEARSPEARPTEAGEAPRPAEREPAVS